MASGGDEDADAVLSDVEGVDALPITIINSSLDEISPERYRELLAELDRERQSREAVESSKADLQVSFNRLKAFAHEAIMKCDECMRQRDEALREKEEVLRTVSAELVEANRMKDEMANQLDKVVKERDGLRLEIGNSTHMLVTGIEKISGKVSNFKNFVAAGLPQSQKYSGLAAVAYGVIKRTNEIVEELLKQVDAAAKSRNETREQMEHRNYEIAIEISQLEATISGLRERASVMEKLEKIVAEKDGKITEIEGQMSEKLVKVDNEALELRQLVWEYDDKLMTLDAKMEVQRPLLNYQLNFVSKIHKRVGDVIKIVDTNDLDQSEVSESLFVPRETDMEENIRASLAGMQSIYELTRIVIEKTQGFIEDKNRSIKSLDETVSRLVKEKEHIGSLLRNALSKRMTSNLSSMTSELFQVAEKDGLREAGIDFKFSNLIRDGKIPISKDKADALGIEDDEICTLAGALENIVKASQLEIIDLQHSIDKLRAESNLLKEHVEAQAKELENRTNRIMELEEKERVANESIEGLMMDIAASEEEITRWKVAAEQEAAAGRAVEDEFLGQLSALKQELEETKGTMLESEKKLKFKEETAAAAMAARDAAEKSLSLADLRASRLRDRVEELVHQLEEFERREDSTGLNASRYVCWPWQWLGLDFVGFSRHDMLNQQSSNEMELFEPLM